MADIRSTMVKNLAKLEMLIGDDFFSTMKGKVGTKNQSKINAKVQEKHEVIERSTKKVEPEMTRSGVSSKSNAKVNESKLNLARTTSMVVPQ